MPLKIEWLDTEQSIICCTGEGTWTWDEYHTTLDTIMNDFKIVQKRVDLVIDRAPGSNMPKGSSMPHFQRAMRIMPPNVGLIVMVTTNGFARAIVSIFSKVYPNNDTAKLVMVGSLSEARARIARDRLKQAIAA
jgi:hypothetical protein